MPCRKRGSSARKDKHILIDDDGVDVHGCFDNICRDYLAQELGEGGGSRIDVKSDPHQAEGEPSEVSEFDKASRMVNGPLLIMNQALTESSREVRRARLKVEVAEKKVTRLRDELEHTRGGPTKTEIRHAYRRGKREIIEIGRSRRETLSGEIDNHKKVYDEYGEFCECRGTMGGLFLTKADNYSFETEFVKQSDRVSCKTKDYSTSQIERRIWEQWSWIMCLRTRSRRRSALPMRHGRWTSRMFC